MINKTRGRTALASIFAAILVFAPGCGSNGGQATSSASSAPPNIDPADFSGSTKVDNSFYPLVPGTQFAYEGKADVGDGLRPHRVIFTVTDLVKVVDGVRCVVIWDRDYNAGRLVEAELAFHAQADDGDVWNLGEYPEEYDATGKFTGAPSTWISGEDGARAGILMPAQPRVDAPAYDQGRAPDIEFWDRARVSKTGETLTTPAGRFRNVLVIDEWSPADPESGHQLKYHAPGVGTVRVGAVGGDQQEFLELVQISRLNPQGVAGARAEALKKRAYQVSAAYRHTQPAAT